MFGSATQAVRSEEESRKGALGGRIPAMAAFCTCFFLAFARGAPASAFDSTAHIPIGLADFCGRFASMCRETTPAAASLDQRGTIIRVNREANQSFTPLDDRDNAALNYRDHWDVVAPGGFGDCDDYALTKMYRLLWEGVPAGAMRLALVAVDHGQFETQHIVLIVRIGAAEFILDCRDATVEPADYPLYRWIEISKEGSLWTWVNIAAAPT